MTIYLLIFYLFDDIEKNIGITHANHSATPNAILTKLHVQPKRLYFLFAFCARHYPWCHGDRCDKKHTKNNYFIQVKPLLLVVEFGNTVTFDSFDVIFTSVTIIKHVFLRKLFYFGSLVDKEISKH